MRLFRRHAPFLSAAVLVSFLAAALPLPALGVEAAPLTVEDAVTNLGVAHAMAEEVAGAVLAALPDRFAGKFRVQAKTDHAGNSILDLAFEEAARKRGLRVGVSESGTYLEYRVLELRIAYTGVDRSAFLTSKEIERHGACVVAAGLVDSATGELIATTQQEVIMADRFDYDLRELVASASYPFTAPTLSEKDWSKSAEPVVVTGMLAGLVYLFFSNQSSD
jgi:hypothetical protein